MPTFSDRENAFENKFAHDAETQFKIDARTNKLMGQWAGGLLGKSGDDIDDYVLEVIKSDFEEAGNEDVIRKVAADLGNKSTDTEIRAKIAEFGVVATEQILAG